MAHLPPPSSRFRWQEFAFTALANAAGTLLALAVAYLGGVAAGVVRANPRVVALIGVCIAFPFVLLFISYSYTWIMERVDERFGLWRSDRP
jgi:hypothetical protein